MTYDDPEGARYAGTSEALRLLELRIDAASRDAVARSVGVSSQAIIRWEHGQAVPLPAVRERIETEFKEILASLWTEPALPPPPPPSLDEVVVKYGIGGSFLSFLVDGPPKFDATPQQRVLVRIVFDNEEPRDLVGRDREIAYELFGTVETVPERARRRAVLRLGRESAKSTITGAYSVFRLLTADLTRQGKNTLPTVVFFSSDAETTRTIFDMASQYLRDVKLNADATEEDNTKSIIFSRPTDGRRVRLRVIVRSAGGVRGRGFPIVAAIVDEAEFMRAAKDDAVIQDEHVIDALAPRLTRGAKIVMLSTPWEEESYAGNLHEENFGKPTKALAATGTTVFMRNNDPDVVALRAELLETDPKLVAREFDCKVVSQSNSLIAVELIETAVALGRQLGIAARGKKGSAGIDLGLRRDHSTLVLVERQEQVLVLTAHHEKTPTPGRPLSAVDVCTDFARIATEAGVHHLTADTHRAEAVREAGLDSGSTVVILDNKAEELATYLASLFREHRIAIADDAQLIRQLKAPRVRAKPGGGLEIIRPRTKGGGHCDLESALECAAWADRRHGPFTVARAQGAAYPRSSARAAGGFGTHTSAAASSASRGWSGGGWSVK